MPRVEQRRRYTQMRVALDGAVCERPVCKTTITDAWWARLENRVYCSWECRRFDSNRLRQLKRRDTVPTQKDYERNAKLLVKYGITQDDYLLMLKEQDGKCAICRSADPRQANDNFHVDHDHVTGVVRGLLCSPCNQGLGYFKDDVHVMAQAIAYLTGRTGEYHVGGD